MAAPTKAEQLEAERERFRAEGWTEDDIRQWLIQKELQKSSPAAAAASFSAPQMPMAGVLGNASAVLSHVGQTIPVVKKNFANLSDGSAPRKSRAKSAAILAGVVVIVAALGYAIYQEWQIHIVNAPLTAAAQAQKAQAEAAVAADVARAERDKAIGGTMPLPDSFNAPYVSPLDKPQTKP